MTMTSLGRLVLLLIQLVAVDELQQAVSDSKDLNSKR